MSECTDGGCDRRAGEYLPERREIDAPDGRGGTRREVRVIPESYQRCPVRMVIESEEITVAREIERHRLSGLQPADIETYAAWVPRLVSQIAEARRAAGEG
jgi:hypothetical protein